MSRNIDKLIHARPTSDGDGVKIRRVAGFQQPGFDPFLMIDELKGDESKDYVGGFPPHPHRGFQTLTLMRKGHFTHKDHLGNEGQLRDGGAQWMRAGRGVIHSEMPAMTDGDLHGFQLWINLPAAEKMSAPQYRDFQAETIPSVALETGTLRLVAGQLNGEAGPLTDAGVPLLVGDLTVEGASFLPIPADHQAMLYVYDGRIELAGEAIEAGQLALLGEGEGVELSGQGGALVLAGRPIGEPVAHYGPFVMNTVAEIDEAIRDYQSGQLVAST